MAQRGRPIPMTTMVQIQNLRPTLSIRCTARLTQTSPNTVIKYQRPTKEEQSGEPGTGSR